MLDGLTWSLVGYAALVGLAFSVSKFIEAIPGQSYVAPAILVQHQVSALVIVVLGTLLRNWKFPRLPMPLVLTIAVLIGVVVGQILFGVLLGFPFGTARTAFQIRASLLAWGLVAAAYYILDRAAQRAAALREAQLDQHRLEEQMLQARLRVMQAQIEPHFLFNTLAHVKRLYQIDEQLAQRMLDSFCRYLEAALPRMRDDNATLGRELGLVNAYLDVQQIRMGKRLKVETAVAESLLAASFPSMMALSLVENAIKHGINPLPEGGAIASTPSSWRIGFT